MLRSKMGSNISWLLLGNVIRMLLSLVTGIITTRYLGPEYYGKINYVAAYTTFFTNICNMGIQGVLIYELTKSPEEEGQYVGSYICLRFIVGILSYISLIVLIAYIEHNDESLVLIAVLQGLQFLFIPWDGVRYWLQWKLLSKYEALIIFISHMITALYKAALVICKAHYCWFAFAISLDVICMAVIYVLVYQKKKIDKLRVSFTTMVSILKQCPPFIISSLLVVIYGKIDTVMIKQIIGSDYTVGLYNAALAIAGILAFVPSAIIDSIRPVLMRKKKEGSRDYHQTFIVSTACVIWIMLGYSAICSFGGNFIIRLLYGYEYMEASGCLRVIVWYTIFSFLGVMKNIWLICENQQKYVPIFSLLGVITNVVLNAILIPRYQIEGAAFATLATQICTNLLYVGFFKSTRAFVHIAISAFSPVNIQLHKLLGKTEEKAEE